MQIPAAELNTLLGTQTNHPSFSVDESTKSRRLQHLQCVRMNKNGLLCRVLLQQFVSKALFHPK
jgi:hypothetical protein